MFLGIDEHLLDAPGFLVLGWNQISVPYISGIRIKAEMIVIGMIGLDDLLQPFGRPGLPFWIKG